MFCWGAPPRRRKMLRLRARGGVSRSRARVTFVPGDKSNQKRHLKLRFKTSLRGEVSANLTVLISRNGHGGCRCRFRGLLVPLAPLPLMRCGGRGWCVGRMDDYQIAPKPPRGRLWQVAADAAGYGGYRLRTGTGSFTPLRRGHLIRHGFAVPPSPRGEGFGRVAFSTFPSRGRLTRTCPLMI